MQKLLFNLVLGMLHLHPATTQTKTFAAGVATICACLGGIATMIVNGDTNAIDYIAAAAGVLVSCGQIFHRDAITKLGNTIEGLTATQGQPAAK